MSDLPLLPASDSSRQRPSAWHEAEDPFLKGAGADPIASKSLIPMDRGVLRQTLQLSAGSLRDMPASAPSAYAAQVVASSSDIASADPVLAEKALPHDLHLHLWRPWASWPLRQKSADPHLGHLSGVPLGAGPAVSSAMGAFSLSGSQRFSEMPIFSTCCSVMESIRTLRSMHDLFGDNHHRRGSGCFWAPPRSIKV